MALYIIDLPGGRAFLCGELGPHCAAPCCADVSGFLCDFPVGDDKTCDRPLCRSHAFEAAPGVHYCPGHELQWHEFVASGGVNERLANVIPFREPKP
jgi:hypothetical protein